jgi:anthranilate phosphoribosyltransferase
MSAELRDAIETLIQRQDLTSDRADAAVEAIIGGADPCQAAALLVLLKAKGETAGEIAGMVRAMRRHMLAVKPSVPCIDIVGTGGDGHHTVNISTAASVVAASCGAAVAKHGNRSVSSMCGSADVLEELGIPLTLKPDAIERCISEAGIAFMFAPGFHPAMKNIVPVRKALGVRTVFNILGPLINPAMCKRGVIGVYAPELVRLMADALHQLGSELILVRRSSRDFFWPAGPGLFSL